MGTATFIATLMAALLFAGLTIGLYRLLDRL
jgi:hypothetical protein